MKRVHLAVMPAGILQHFRPRPCADLSQTSWEINAFLKPIFSKQLHVLLLPRAQKGAMRENFGDKSLVA